MNDITSNSITCHTELDELDAKEKNDAFDMGLRILRNRQPRSNAS